MSWRIELSPSAVRSLRALPREEQRAIAARLGHLEETGLPRVEDGPGREEDSVPPGTDLEDRIRLIPAGDRFLACLEEPDERRIVVLALHAPSASLATTAARVALRRVRSLAGGRGTGKDDGGGGRMEGMTQDLRFAFRSLRKSPGFTLVAVLTLALGIGAATAIFSVADGVLLEPLPYGEPDEVVTIWASWDNFPEKTWLSVPEFQLFHQENRSMEDMALYQTGSVNFTSVDNPERVGAAIVTPNICSVLGVEPVVGRVPSWEEVREDDDPVLVAYETWQRRWGGDPAIVGTTVEVDGRLRPVLGVLPAGFVLPVDYASPSVSEVFLPTYVDLESPAPPLGSGGSHGSYGVGRLRDGSSVEDARQDLERIMAQVEPRGLYSPQRRFAPRVFEAKEDIVGGAKGTILLLLGAVALVLLIACGNVANLLLARSEIRGREVAIRSAVGAGRGRILRQLFTENLILAVAGGVLGVGLAGVGVRALLAIDPAAVPRSAAVGIDVSVLLFALGSAVLTAVMFGTMPALRLIRRGRDTSLHEGQRDGGTSSRRLQGLLVATQMAMAVILFLASGLMIRSFVRLLEVDPGFEADDVLTLRITASEGSYPDPESVVTFYEDLLRRIREIPGVRAAGGARILPLASTMGDAGFHPEGYVPGPDEATQAEWQWATPGYLEVMGIPLLEGRTFDDRDRSDGQEVIIINESLARRYWGNRSPLGSRVRVFDEEAVVVGVVGDVAHNGITGSIRGRFYRPHAQVDGVAQRSLSLAIATEGPPRRYLDAVRNAVHGMDPSIPLSQVQTLEEVLASARAQPRFTMVLLAVFSGVALVLALVGIYGVVSYAVSRRVREIGIRMALGAGSGKVVRLMVRQGMVMALAGVVVGTAAALLLTGFMRGMLYGVEAQDPATFLLVPVVFAGVALLACWVPAIRATRVDPANALRYE